MNVPLEVSHSTTTVMMIHSNEDPQGLNSKQTLSNPVFTIFRP